MGATNRVSEGQRSRNYDSPGSPSSGICSFKGLYSTRLPIAVDLDGTITTRTTALSLLWIFKSGISIALRSVFSGVLKLLTKEGRRDGVSFRAILDNASDFDPKSCIYNANLVNKLREIKSSGGSLILTTGASEGIAKSVAEHLGLFDMVLHSTKHMRNVGENKAKTLVELFGEQGFVYIGNDWLDIPVWEMAKVAVLVNTPHGLQDLMRKKHERCIVMS